MIIGIIVCCWLFRRKSTPAFMYGVGKILVLALFFVGLNLLVDIAQAAIDPRIKRS